MDSCAGRASVWSPAAPEALPPLTTCALHCMLCAGLAGAAAGARPQLLQSGMTQQCFVALSVHPPAHVPQQQPGLSLASLYIRQPAIVHSTQQCSTCCTRRRRHSSVACFSPNSRSHQLDIDQNNVFNLLKTSSLFKMVLQSSMLHASKLSKSAQDHIAQRPSSPPDHAAKALQVVVDRVCLLALLQLRATGGCSGQHCRRRAH